MKQMSSKFIHRKDSELYGNSTDQFETLKTASVFSGGNPKHINGISSK